MRVKRVQVPVGANIDNEYVVGSEDVKLGG